MSKRAEAQFQIRLSSRGPEDKTLNESIDPPKYGSVALSKPCLSYRAKRRNPDFNEMACANLFQGMSMPARKNSHDSRTFRKISDIKSRFDALTVKSYHANFVPYGETDESIPPTKEESQLYKAEMRDCKVDGKQSLVENSGNKMPEETRGSMQTDDSEDAAPGAVTGFNEIAAKDIGFDGTPGDGSPAKFSKWSIRFVRPPEVREEKDDERSMAKTNQSGRKKAEDNPAETVPPRSDSIDKLNKQTEKTTLKLEIDDRIDVNKEREGPRPEMKHPDIIGKRQADLRPWSMDVEIALRDMIGDISRPSEMPFEQMVLAWKRGYNSYFGTLLENDRYPYIWIDVHTIDAHDKRGKLKFISLVGADCQGIRKLLALVEANPDDPELWQNILKNLEIRGLANPRLFVGDSELLVWQCLSSIFPRAESQYSWREMKKGILSRISQENMTEANALLDRIYFAENIQNGFDHLDQFKSKYCARYPRAVAELVKNRDNLFTFFRYPRKHWKWIKNSGHLSWAYPADVLLTTVFKHAGFRDIAIYLVFNYLLRTRKRWPRLKGVRHLRRIQAGKAYQNGKSVGSRKHNKSIVDKYVQDCKTPAPRFFQSIRGLLSILNSRRFSKKSPLNIRPTKTEDVPGGMVFSEKQSDLNKTKINNPVADMLMDRWKSKAHAAKDDLAANTGDNANATKKIRGAKPAQSISNQPSSRISGLERELLEELQLKKNVAG